MKQKSDKQVKGFQQSLDKWFVRTDKEGNLLETHFTIFYLDWETQTATWLSNMPEADKINYRTVVKWGNHNIHVIGNIPLCTQSQSAQTQTETQAQTQTGLNDTNTNKTHTDYETYYTNVSFLKSHLQKTIRRSQVCLAIKTAFHFYRLDPGECLRRLTIIMLEDVHLMLSFNVLLWLMVAHSKGYHLIKSQVYWLYGLVYNLAISKYWDRIEMSASMASNDDISISTKILIVSSDSMNSTDTTNHNTDTVKTVKPQEIKEDDWKMHLPKLSTSQKSLIYSLQFRKAFGGLTGDKKLIQNFTNIWIQRFINTRRTSTALEQDTSPQTEYSMWSDAFWCHELEKPVCFLSPPEEPLTLDQWILPAIDFHCAPNILSILSDKYSEFTHEELKETIWHCSSKYNNKLHATSDASKNFVKYGKIWEVIRPQFYGLSNYFLTHNY